MSLRNSEHRGDASIDLALELAREFRGRDEDGYRAEFIRLMELARESLVADRLDR
jgi:Ca-activated chloride channel family protein